MNTYVHPSEGGVLKQYGLLDFDRLWNLQLPAVDEPNLARGGWSQVFKLVLGGRTFYLKRQENYLTRSLRHPFGEPTLAREFRAIRRYRRLRIPALSAAFFATRKQGRNIQAILLTPALEGWKDLSSYLEKWTRLDAAQRQSILSSIGGLARRLHGRCVMHGCFYPKHIFLRQTDKGFESCLIDLEKSRRPWMGYLDRIRELEPLLRRAQVWSRDEVRSLLGSYLRAPSGSRTVTRWMQWLLHRQRHKE